MYQDHDFLVDIDSFSNEGKIRFRKAGSRLKFIAVEANYALAIKHYHANLISNDDLLGTRDLYLHYLEKPYLHEAEDTRNSRSKAQAADFTQNVLTLLIDTPAHRLAITAIGPKIGFQTHRGTGPE